MSPLRNERQTMKYSVIIPTYNSAKVIKRCIDSIIEQTYKDLEILVLDGSSKDDTVQIANSYKDKRIKVYSELDKGVYDAMNKGIDKAEGDWLLFLGSDDNLLNRKVLEDVARYLDDNYHVVYGDCQSERLYPENSGEWTLSTLSFNRCHQGIFYNKKFWETGVRYNLKYKLLADYVVNLKWFLDTSHFKSKYIPVMVSFFNAGGISNVIQDDEFYKDYGKNLWQYGKRSLPLKYKQFALRKKASNMSNKNPMKLFYCGLYVIYYSAYKLSELFHVDQERLR